MLLHLVDDGPDEDGAEVAGVEPLPHVALYGDGVPRLEAVLEPRVVEELHRLRGQA